MSDLTNLDRPYAGLQILVIDDSAAIRTVLKLQFQLYGAESEVTGVFGINPEKEFDIALIDYNYGEGLLSAVRLQERWPNMTIIIMSGHSEIAGPEFPFLGKPIEFGLLSRRLMEVAKTIKVRRKAWNAFRAEGKNEET